MRIEKVYETVHFGQSWPGNKNTSMSTNDVWIGNVSVTKEAL